MGFNAEGGSRNFNFATRRSHSELHRFLRLTRGYRRPKDGFFLRAESFFNVATQIERLDEEPAAGRPIIASYGDRSLHEQSHGESFLALLTNRIIAPHSPIIMAYPDARIFLLSEQGVAPIAHEETEHFTVSRNFFRNREQMLRVLLDS